MGIMEITMRAMKAKINSAEAAMNLINAEEGTEYIIRAIDTDDEEMNAFLFSLGCYAGEPITVISHLRGGHIVSIKESRYTIDNELAGAILI